VCIFQKLCVSFTSCVSLSKVVCLFHKLCVSFKSCVSLSQVVCLFQKMCVSFTSCVSLSQVVCLFHKLCVSFYPHKMQQADTAVTFYKHKLQQNAVTVYQDKLQQKPHCTGVPGIGQITWWTVCWPKMRGHFGKKLHANREIAVEWAVGVWVHRDSWLVAQMGSVLEPNTNAQRMLLLSYLLRSAWYPLVPNVGASRTVPNRESRYLPLHHTAPPAVAVTCYQDKLQDNKHLCIFSPAV